ncbi:acyl-CoA-binding protein [Bacillus mesophilus]|uniref:Uncharacterized protein n=1 Tax=Bacillus mesophilus TaxID=1808955 RepID=A0A6M0QBC5_9BACI|nr:hypothetical protein [Bacillus mesophilus]MBM7661650.1 acyl-CoA-binding protein [Bacillus mesophilus]NEY72318.1 hypothetical protein [Bacillus mesophilus]
MKGLSLVYISACILVIFTGFLFIGKGLVDFYFEEQGDLYTVHESFPSTFFDHYSKNNHVVEEMSEMKPVSKKDTEASEGIKEVEEIKVKYRALLTDLEQHANQKLSSLLSEAVKEYKSIKEKGEPVSYLELFAKYKLAAENLEKEIDQSFEEIIVTLEGELKSNGFSSSYVTVLREEYEAIKDERQTELLKKVTNQL